MQVMMQGARLAFVVRPIPGDVIREKTVWSKEKGLEKAEKKEPGGFLVYFPRGHVLRLNAEMLKHYRLDREPGIISMDGLYNPDSPLGKLIRAEDEGGRFRAFKELEEQCIRMATVKTGSHVMPEQQAAASEPRIRQGKAKE